MGRRRGAGVKSKKKVTQRDKQKSQAEQKAQAGSKKAGKRK